RGRKAESGDHARAGRAHSITDRRRLPDDKPGDQRENQRNTEVTPILVGGPSRTTASGPSHRKLMSAHMSAIGVNRTCCGHRRDNVTDPKATSGFEFRVLEQTE